MVEKSQYQKFESWSNKQQFSLKDLFPLIGKSGTFQIDLSINNTTVKTESEFNNLTFFEEKLAEIQHQHPNKIIAGGYLEKRALYTSDIYNAENSTQKINIHLGVDFWLPKNTAIHSILNGKVVCAIHQKDHKGYGGFIILKHELQDFEFYTLYGHLSQESVSKYEFGDEIKVGDKIGVLGNYYENGEWVPHLHFQVMLSLLDFKNDFPGVVLESEIDYWKVICPNPNLLFTSDFL